MWVDFHVQRDLAVTWSEPPAALDASDLDQTLTFRGFIVSDFSARYEDFSAWVREGRIKYREDVVEGLENAPRALIGLLRGENFGKLLVCIAR
jgi:NADPH-dependent curcumin reductase CurA